MFIANGDYNFPFDFVTYFIKHFYMWSSQTGTPNPDGIIRLPGRIFNFIVFATSGNIAVGYFYQLACLVVAFFAFYYFCRAFLNIKDKLVCYLGAAFFAINPIFLGNLSKVGLVLAAVMLPLCLVAIKQAFSQRRFSLLLLYVLCLNISLLHPYTFFVNLAVSGAYLGYMLWKNWTVARHYMRAIIGVGILALACNAYLILPIASMGTVSKDVISDNVTPIKADYTALVDVSNTGDVFTGLAMSKNIFLDFEFYNTQYQNIYFLGAFLLYIVLLLVYLKVEQQLSVAKKRIIVVCFGCFLVLIALATVNLFNMDVIIKFLIGLPGGWAFRSPLKWQLYIPFALFCMMVILLVAVRDKQLRIGAMALVVVSFVLMNGYQIFDVAKRQLTPRQMQYFSELTKMDLKGKNLLFVNSPECMKEVIPYNSNVVTELNQVFTSTDMQVKRAWADSIDRVNLATYDYVLTCRRNISSTLRNDYGFTPKASFVQTAMVLYANPRPRPAIHATDTLYGIDDSFAVNNKQTFIKNTLGSEFNFVENDKVSVSRTAIRDMFADLSPDHLENGMAISDSVTLPSREGSRLVLGFEKSPLFGKVDGNSVTVAPVNSRERKPFQDTHSGKYATIPLAGGQLTTLRYEEKGYDFKNLIKNPSLEEGLWQKEVDDCLNTDANAKIAMRLSDDKTDGKAALELEATKHIACTGPASIAVKPGEHYLLSFDYQAPGGKSNAGYYIGFDGLPEQSADKRLTVEGTGWQSLSQEVIVPARATSMRILFYGYPDESESAKRISRFDNVSVVHVPALQNRFYVQTPPVEQLARPHSIEFSRQNPTEWKIHINNATKPFYLMSQESYHDKWQLQSSEYVVDGARHFAVNSTMNGWYIDPARLCEKGACTKAADGSYDIDMKMVFVPQQWFYIGGLISIAATVVGGIWYIRDRRPVKGRRAR